MNTEKISFDELASNIQQIHNITSKAAHNAVNQALTVRNWAIGYYIVEYEQDGKEHSSYGSRLLTDLADRISIRGLDRSVLNICRSFYLKYPQICETVTHKLQGIGLPKNIVMAIEENDVKYLPICETVNHKFEMNPEILVNKLSFSHFRELITIDDPFERYFYELECIKGTWSVKELHRQISTNLFVRAGIE